MREVKGIFFLIRFLNFLEIPCHGTRQLGVNEIMKLSGQAPLYVVPRTIREYSPGYTSQGHVTVFIAIQGFLHLDRSAQLSISPFQPGEIFRATLSFAVLAMMPVPGTSHERHEQIQSLILPTQTTLACPQPPASTALRASSSLSQSSGVPLQKIPWPAACMQISYP